MPTFKINNDRVIVTDDRGDTLNVTACSPKYREACNLAMSACWNDFATLALSEIEDERIDEDEFGSIDLPNIILVVTGLLQDEIINPIDIGISITATQHGAHHEHDLSQWSGSPIFYPTREMAREQSDRWGMFWEYHDFGKDAPVGYRYATVPRLSQAPTAPDGYDWVCLPREEV